MADRIEGPQQPGGKKEMPMEVRLLLAFLLMGVVLFLTPYFYKPAQAPPAAKPVPAAKPAAPETPPPPKAAAPEPAPGSVAAEREQESVVETDLYRVRFSNRGAVVRSWVLKEYVDNTGKPLELVNQAAAGKTGYPFELEFKDRQPPADLDQALFAARPSADSLGIEFEFSNGAVLCRKSFRFRKDRYLTEVSTEVIAGGATIPHWVVWRGGFGDPSVPNAASVQHTLYWDVADNSLVVNEATEAKEGPVTASGRYSFAGLEDTYFAAVALPQGESSFEVRTYSDTLPSPEGKEADYVGAGLGGDGRNRFAMFVGPKDIDVLRRVDPKLEQVVDFGWFGFLAKPLFLALNWVNDQWVHNYGWAIVLVTVAINFLLLPLKFTSLKSMKKMQLLQPQIAAINAKYKGLSIRDPRKGEQNQEIMDLYRKNGVNPMGGCMPMVLQIPFFIAFYKVLTVAIEMRGANWLWVNDLSQPENLPIRVLPVAMIATQFVMQKMTPSTSADPTQQRVMLLMPLMLGFMFYGVSSGLVLYWLTGNVVGIVQQWFFNRAAHPSVVEATPKAPKKKRGSRN